MASRLGSAPPSVATATTATAATATPRKERKKLLGLRGTAALEGACERVGTGDPVGWVGCGEGWVWGLG